MTLSPFILKINWLENSTWRCGSLFIVCFISYVDFFITCIVSAVRLMRIELGSAFADRLNKKGKGSGDNEMGYVERTLGFRTKELDNRDLRLVVTHPFLVSCTFAF